MLKMTKSMVKMTRKTDEKKHETRGVIECIDFQVRLFLAIVLFNEPQL